MSASGCGNASRVTVCARIRPFLQREKGQTAAVQSDGNTVGIQVCSASADWRHFTFDACLGIDAGQDVLYSQVGHPILQNALSGFNGSLFAYGQTGSGKTFSIMGTRPERGVIPQLLNNLFDVAERDSRSEPASETRVSVSFLEIYNEDLNDLLDPRPRHKKLYVHQHPQIGVYVPHLTEAATPSVGDAMRLLDFGSKIRATAQTNMNSTSSRSHSVLTLRVVQVFKKGKIRKSNMNLCDLAGSERAKKTGARGQRMREGNAINSSLSVLGQVISKLASGADKKGVHVPFRQSKLTHLLMDALCGNSVTTMLANISPARSEVEESLSTLRFADNVKKIQTKPKVSEMDAEEPEALLRTLASEIQMLKNVLVEDKTGTPEDISRALEETMYVRNAVSGQIGGDWQQAVEQTKALEVVHQQLLEERCLPLYEVGQLAGVKSGTAYLLNVSDDPSLSGCLLYFLQPQVTLVGRGDPNSLAPNHVVLQGLGIPTRLASITISERLEGAFFQITKMSGELERGRVLVNGKPLETGEVAMLTHGSRIIFGWAFCFRLVVPGALEVEKDINFESLSQEVLQYSMTTTMENMDMIKAVTCWSTDLERRGMGMEEREQIMEAVGEVGMQIEEANALCDEVYSARPDTLPVQFDVGLSMRWAPSPKRPAATVVVEVWKNREGQQQLLAAWPASEFERRLQWLRDAHREVLKGTDDSRWAWKLSSDEWWLGEALGCRLETDANAEYHAACGDQDAEEINIASLSGSA